MNGSATNKIAPSTWHRIIFSTVCIVVFFVFGFAGVQAWTVAMAVVLVAWLIIMTIVDLALIARSRR